MISCIEWVPKGVADPNPKKYEMSAVELDLLEKQAEMEAALDDDNNNDNSNSNPHDDDSSSSDDDEMTTTTPTNRIVLPKIDPKSLPSELRMDEYSDDEDDDEDAVQGSMLGRILVGNDSEMLGNQLDANGMPITVNDEGEGDEKDDDMDDDNDDDDSDDEEDDDDLADIPDTREYMPTDIAGLAAMGISHAGASALLDDDDSGNEDDDNSDADDVQLSPNDAIVICAKTEDDFAALEVMVYEERAGNLFVHHDIPLPSFPLCLAHGDINDHGNAGNYVAVGTFSPGIEVWNLDVLHVLEPTCVLGGPDTSAADELMKRNMVRAATGKKQSKKSMIGSNRGSGLKPGSHTEAVMALSWNKIHRQVIASGSADKTVKIWDITKCNDLTTSAATTFTHHKDKVQAVEWHPTEGTLLATGSYDRTVAILDARSTGKDVKKVKLSADVESIRWDPHHSQYLTVATEDGTLTNWDVRQLNKPVWSFVVEEYGGVSDLSYNPNVPGMLATCAVNKTVTLWDTYNAEKTGPSLQPPVPCGNKEMQVGKLYSLSFYGSSNFLLGCAGGGNELALWDMTREDAVQKRFGERVIRKSVVDANTTATSSTTSDGQAAAAAPTKDQQQGEEKMIDNKEQDFEAMMAAKDSAAAEIREKAANNKNNKNKGKKKKKGGAHKKGK